jgi:glycerol uptake facilitator-like aquaporin
VILRSNSFRTKIVLAVVAAQALAAVLPAAAQRMTYDDYWKEAHQNPGVITKEYSKTTVVTDEKNFTVYFFTKPGTPAHPGVIVRKLVNEKDGAYFETYGHSDGPDSTQPAFKTWMANPLK